MTAHLNRAGHNVSNTPGTGDITLGSVPDGYISALGAGAVNGGTYEFTIESVDGLVWEIGYYTYRTAGPTLERTTPRLASNGGAGPIDLPSGCVVYSTVSSESIDLDTSASAAAAAASAAAALVSENAAAASAAAASTSEGNAATSETNAAASETAAGLSEAAASASETAAGLSETAAAASEGVAAAAAISATASEGAAASSASAASTSEGNAATSETNAAASALAASNSETAAGISETNAAASAAAAAASAASVDVNKVGTPADDEVAVWTGDGTIEGASTLTFDGTSLTAPGMTVNSINGVDVNPGSDTHVNLLTVGVTGAPRMDWNEAANAFHFTKSLILSDNEDGEITHTIAGTSVESQLELHSEGATELGGIAIHRHSTANNFGGHVLMMKSEGTHDLPTVVGDNDVFGRLIGLGYDGTDYELGAEIQFLADGTPGNNDMPGEIKFFTNGGSQTLTERMSIRADGTIEIAGSVELGHATDTTLARIAAGRISVEGNELATLATTQSFTNKTLTAPAITAAVITTTVDAGWTGTEALDPANGDIQEITLTGNVTTLTDNMADGESIIMQIDDGTAYAITWPTIVWTSDSAAAPTLQTTGDTWITIWKSGTLLYGHAANGA